VNITLYSIFRYSIFR